MRFLAAIAIFITLSVGCRDTKTANKENCPCTPGSVCWPTCAEQISDTLVESRSVLHETAGSNYLKRAQEYFVIIRNDTSEFRCTFQEMKDTSLITIDIRSKGYAIPYRRRKSELYLILRKASEDFNIRTLRSAFMGRLIQSGDLAIQITNEYQQEFGETFNVTAHKKVADFLLRSSLSKEMNELFYPFGVVVQSVSPEKIFFAPSTELHRYSAIEADSSMVPEKVLDCLTWIRFKTQPAKSN